jgi:hypothetical protein
MSKGSIGSDSEDNVNRNDLRLVDIVGNNRAGRSIRGIS